MDIEEVGRVILRMAVCLPCLSRAKSEASVAEGLPESFPEFDGQTDQRAVDDEPIGFIGGRRGLPVL